VDKKKGKKRLRKIRKGKEEEIGPKKKRAKKKKLIIIIKGQSLGEDYDVSRQEVESGRGNGV
jgi:hypothetical protein